MSRIIIAIAIILFAAPAWCGSISEEIAKTQNEIVRLESQKRLSADMEPKGLRRTIAAKKEYLNELYLMQNGASSQDIQMRRQQKQLDRIERNVNAIQANQWNN